MQARCFSPLRKGALALMAAPLLVGCGGDKVTDPEPVAGDHPALAGNLSPVAQRLNREILEVLPKAPGKDWVFDGYSDPVTKEVAWSRFWTGKMDFTGIGWDSAHTATLITPRHVVMAKHFPRPLMDVVRLHDRRGREVQRVLTGIVKLEGPYDVAVGILNEPVPDGVAHYKLPEPADDLPANLIGALALVTDVERKVHVHQCRFVSADSVAFEFSKSLPKGFGEELIRGDSGNPSFVLVRGELVLLETHTFGGPGSGPFYGSPQIQAGIRAAIAELAVQFGGGEYSFATVRP